MVWMMPWCCIHVLVLLRHRKHACIATKFIIVHTRQNVLVGRLTQVLSSSLALIITLEDLRVVVKQAREQSGHVPKLLSLAKDQIQFARVRWIE